MQDIEQFTKWAAGRTSTNGRLDQTAMSLLAQEQPFFYKVIMELRDAQQNYLRDRHWSRKRRVIERRDRRYQNRWRRLLSPNLDRSGTKDEYNLCRLLSAPIEAKCKYKGRDLPSETELWDSLEADLKAVNEDLASQDFRPVIFTKVGRCYKHPYALMWQLDASVVTDLATDDEYDLGQYEVYLLSSGSIHVYGGDYKCDGYCHPHVYSDGSLCTGDYQNFFDLLVTSGSLMAAYQTINSILCHYNKDSPYVNIGKLVYGEDEDSEDDDDDTIECHDCGCHISSEDSYYISDNEYCSECVWTCDKCYEHFATEFNAPIDFDGNCYCEDCAAKFLVKCFDCDEWMKEADATWGRTDDGDLVPLCDSCRVECPECGKDMPWSEAKGRHYQGKYYCQDCIDELQITCHMCGTMVFKDSSKTITPTGGEEVHVCATCHSKLEGLGVTPARDQEPPYEPSLDSEETEEPANVQVTPDGLHIQMDEVLSEIYQGQLAIHLV